MAEGKKSFIIYTSWKRWLDGLTKEQKGIWLDWMLDYTNDLNPEYPTDQAVKVACLMAQDTLKRDLQKYNDKVERIKSARNQNPNNNIKLKSDSNQSEISSVNVNDNVNVNVNDNVNVNVVSKETNNIYTVGNPPVEYVGLFDFWNSKPNLIHHKEINEARFKAFKKVLKIYSCDEIHKAIDRYSMILESDYRFTYKWSLEDFLNRKNGISNFMDEGSVWCSFQQAAKINPYLIPGKREERKPNEMIKAFLSKVGEK
jgi:hypothetical protein